MGADPSQHPNSIENIRADATTITYQPQQDVLGMHIAAPLPLSFVQSQGQHLASPWHVVNLLFGRLVATPYLLYYRGADPIPGDA